MECGEPRHVGLRALTPEQREEIRRFVLENKGKLTYEQMREEIRRRWCLDLNPGQLARLARPRTRRVALPEDVVEFLEGEFGSVGEGIRQVLTLARQMMREVPPDLKRVARELGGGEYTWAELEERLVAMGYEDVSDVVSRLARHRLLRRAPGGKYRVLRVPMPDELVLLQLLAGLG